MSLLHRRQYLLGPTAWPGWPSRRLAVESPASRPPLVVSHHPDLTCRQVGSASGCWTLLGDPVQTSSGDPAPDAALARANVDDVGASTRSWAGRWLLVDPTGRVHLDAAGLLGCLVRRSGGQTWASSSPALLADLPDLPRLPDDGRSLVHDRGANWHASPGAGFPGLDRVLPSQVLDLTTGQVLPRRLLPELAPITVEAAATELQQRLTSGLVALQAQASQVWIALTAGLDSRTVLACAVAAGLPVRTCTQLDDKMSLADRELPPRLARAAGVPHVFLPPGRPDRSRLELFDAHTGAGVQDRDRVLYPRGQYDFLGADDVLVRANAFEVARSSWHRRGPRGHGGSQVPPLPVLMAVLYESPGTVFEHDLDRWRTWASEHPEPGLLWQDRMYWEQRMGAWAASVEQSLDLLDGRSVVLPNCQAVYEALLALPEADRAAKSAQQLLIASAAPALAVLPLNPPTRSFPARVRWLDSTRRMRGRGVRATARRVVRRKVRPVVGRVLRAAVGAARSRR